MLHNRSSASDGLEVFERLTNGLDQVEARDRGHIGTQIAVRSEEKVFVKQTRLSVTPDAQEICDRFGEVSIADLIDQQCFSRVRNGIAEKKGRTAAEQHAWEQQIQEEAKLMARKLLQKLELDLCRSGNFEPAGLRSKLLHLYPQYASEWMAFSARCHCDLCKRIA